MQQIQNKIDEICEEHQKYMDVIIQDYDASMQKLRKKISRKFDYFIIGCLIIATICFGLVWII